MTSVTFDVLTAIGDHVFLCYQWLCTMAVAVSATKWWLHFMFPWISWQFEGNYRRHHPQWIFLWLDQLGANVLQSFLITAFPKSVKKIHTSIAKVLKICKRVYLVCGRKSWLKMSANLVKFSCNEFVASLFEELKIVFSRNSVQHAIIVDAFLFVLSW